MVQLDLKYDDDPRVALLKELADPLRLRIIDRLGNGGPASPSELATLLGVPLPQLSNHLKRLRDAGLVRSERHGRHVTYELADRGLPILVGALDRLGNGGPASPSELATLLGVPLPQLSNHLKRLRDAGLVRRERHGRHVTYELADRGLPILVGAIDRLTGRVARPPQRQESPFAAARTCYDHLAGGLGVALYRSLREAEAVRERPDGTIGLGPRSLKVFGAMGMKAPRLRGDRRRFAFECFDATEHAPHLGGALGDALAEALTRQGWIEHLGDRAVRLTDAGAAGLQQALGEPAQ